MIKITKTGTIKLGGEKFGVIHNGKLDMFYYDLHVNQSAAELACMIPDLIQCIDDSMMMSRCDTVGEIQMKENIKRINEIAKELLKKSQIIE